MEKSKVMLVVIDGYGEGKDYPGNAVKKAKTPYLNELRKKHPQTYLKASGEAVGLPKGTMGGSEVGHYTIGAGRTVYQTLERINKDIRDGSFFKNKALLSAIKHVKKKKSTLHLLGMISDAGVHSHINHLFALLELCKKEGIHDVAIHCITDGRDVQEKSAQKYIKKIQQVTKKIGIGSIASIVGRYYAMDRDKNWKRSKKAYDLMVSGTGLHCTDPIKAIKKAYELGDETDYYIRPITVDPTKTIADHDAIIFFNYRTDRSKQLTQSFTAPETTDFDEKKVKTHFVCFGPYSKTAPIAFPELQIKNNLGSYLSSKKKTQLRVAETEKYAHVTFFFNSQRKEPYAGEDQILVPSPKAASYADAPEMSAAGITTKTITAIKKKAYDFVLVNYANPDLVGHSGNLKATIKGIECIDTCLQKLIPAAQKQGYDILLTSDHGNAEYMQYPNGDPCPSHTLNTVFFCVITQDGKQVNLKKGQELEDIAPTVLSLLQLDKPKEMTGENLIISK